MNLRNLAIWGVLIVVLLAVYTVMQNQPHGQQAPVSYSQLLKRIDAGEISRITVADDTVVAEVKQPAGAKTPAPKLTTTVPTNYESLNQRAEAKGVEIGRAHV